MKVVSMVVCLLALVPLSANSVPVKWDVDVQLDDGSGTGTVTGTFVYDVNTNSFADVNVSAVGDMFPASSATLTSFLYQYSNAHALDFVPTAADFTGLQDVYIVLAQDMTDAGGVIDVNIIQTYECLDAPCDIFSSVLYGGIPIVGTITSVPLPAAVWLFGSGLLGLVGIARRKNST
jgi:hypothetical protein